MATSKRVTRCLQSTKNLAGCLAGLLGVVLHLAGVVGGYWLLVVLALYAVGALVAPPDRVHLVSDPNAEAVELRAELDRLAQTVHEHRDRLPDGAAGKLDRITAMLGELLQRPEDLAAGRHETLTDVRRLVGIDVPLCVQTYLNMPRWYATTARATHDRTAAQELLDQLDLLTTDTTNVAARHYQTYRDQQDDLGRYLEDRNRET